MYKNLREDYSSTKNKKSGAFTRLNLFYTFEALIKFSYNFLHCKSCQQIHRFMHRLYIFMSFSQKVCLPCCLDKKKFSEEKINTIDFIAQVHRS